MAVRQSVRSKFVAGRTVSRPQGLRPARDDPGPRSDPSIFRFATEIRGRYLLAIDLVGIVVAAYLALALRFDRFSGPVFVPAFPVVVVLLLAVRTTINIQVGFYTRRWRFASVPDLERIVAAVSLGSLVAMVIFYGTSAVGNTTWQDGFPRSFWLAELLLSVAILGGVRFSIRAASGGLWPA